MSRRGGSRASSVRAQGSAQLVLVLLVVGLFLAIGACCALWAIVGRVTDGGSGEATAEVRTSGLVVAYSPEKELAFRALVEGFNEQGFESPDGETMGVEAVSMSPEAMVDAVLQGNASFQALAPDSTIWLGQLDEEWQASTNSEALAVGEIVRFAVSPVVIAMWE